MSSTLQSATFAPGRFGPYGGRYPVLSGPRFGHDAGLAHFYRQQTLANGVVNFVRAGVQQIFAFQINPGAAQLVGEPFRKL